MMEDSENLQLRRILWVSMMAMLRTIADTLDRDPNKKVRQAYQKARKSWEQERTGSALIFFEFIVHERNKRTYHALLDSFGHSDDEDMNLAFMSENSELEVADLTDIYWPMVSGPFSGTDARDVAHEAINWWRHELKKMEIS